MNSANLTMLPVQQIHCIIIVCYDLLHLDYG